MKYDNFYKAKSSVVRSVIEKITLNIISFTTQFFVLKTTIDNIASENYFILEIDFSILLQDLLLNNNEKST